MHSNGKFGSLNKSASLRFIESVGAYVEIVVRSSRHKPFKGIERECAACYFGRNLRCTRFDLSAMRRDDYNWRRSNNYRNPIGNVFHFMGG
jgi:hypothetical protein